MRRLAEQALGYRHQVDLVLRLEGPLPRVAFTVAGSAQRNGERIARLDADARVRRPADMGRFDLVALVTARPADGADMTAYPLQMLRQRRPASAFMDFAGLR